ncbi:Short transient receptor potential channel 2 [Stylophora pistillata]|uniref:Short transient receptor potential channel 2 n=1 Tax=Stylophora pistillata TaxID=50429 RepID=A0A2B4SBU9_STYPI|nr:Short transient receptor potential channel 2 [Stylophora pistillata]
MGGWRVTRKGPTEPLRPRIGASPELEAESEFEDDESSYSDTLSEQDQEPEDAFVDRDALVERVNSRRKGSKEPVTPGRKASLELYAESGAEDEHAPSDSDSSIEQDQAEEIENELDHVLRKGDFDAIKEKVTPKTLSRCKTNTLLKAFQVNKALRDLSGRGIPEKDDIEKLEKYVNEFTSALVDPLKTNADNRRTFQSCFDCVVDEAIDTKQKKADQFIAAQKTGLKVRKMLKRYTPGDQPEENEAGDDNILLKQFIGYFSDRWNVLDFVILVLYLITFTLRIITWITSTNVSNNRLLAVSGYFYGFIAMFLTLRAFGQVIECARGMGAIQIALFSIIWDVMAIFWQFLATILAFSLAMTKIYVAEKVYMSGKDSAEDFWWNMAKHLSWSLLGIADLDKLNSVDIPSVSLIHLLYSVFLIMAVILLVNMMIALVSNTYQQVQSEALDKVVKKLESIYFQKFGYEFPLTEDKKINYLVQVNEGGRKMTDQIVRQVFRPRGNKEEELTSGQRAWYDSPGIAVDGCLLTYKGPDFCNTCKIGIPKHIHSAKFKSSFTPETPRFEVLIQETGKRRIIALGAVCESYDAVDNCHTMPGWDSGTVGYHVYHGKIFETGCRKKGREVEAQAT